MIDIYVLDLKNVELPVKIMAMGILSSYNFKNLDKQIEKLVRIFILGRNMCISY